MLFLCSYVPSTGIRGEASLKQKKIELSTSEVQPKFNWSSVELQLWRSWIIHMQMSSRSTVEAQLSFNYMQICELNAGWTRVENFTCKWARVQLLKFSWASTICKYGSRTRVERELKISHANELAFNCWISVKFQLAFNPRSTRIQLLNLSWFSTLAELCRMVKHVSSVGT